MVSLFNPKSNRFVIGWSPGSEVIMYVRGSYRVDHRAPRWMRNALGTARVGQNMHVRAL